MESLKAFDLGGFDLSFSAQEHQGNYQVFLTQIHNGQVAPVR